MAEEQPQPAEKPKGPGLMGLVKAIVIVAVLVVVEMVGAAMLVPSAEETEALARDLARAASGEELNAVDSVEADPLDGYEATKEVEIGAFNVTRFNPETDATLNVDCVIFGVILAEEEVEFLEQFAVNNSRIHEQIVMTLHAAQSADLTSAGLGLIKRQILEKTNRALGRPLLQEVVFTKINFVER